MDAAFVRRLRFILQFPGARPRPAPAALGAVAARARRGAHDDLELDALADRFQLTGGAIHNIGLAAAHLAAATPAGRITLAHVIRATQRELQKAGRPPERRLRPLAGAEQVTGTNGAGAARRTGRDSPTGARR